MGSVEITSFEMVERIKQSGSIEEIYGYFEMAIKGFGFKYFFISGVPYAGENMMQDLIFSTYPKEAYERYMKNKTPEEYKDEFQKSPGEENEKSSQTYAATAGSGDTVQLSVSSQNGFHGVVTIGGSSRDPSQREWTALQFICSAVYSRVVEIIAALASQEEVIPHLTTRELDCLKWASVGKTAWEIGKILNISENTANEYFRSISHKLNCTNRVHAVAQALRLKLIE